MEALGKKANLKKVEDDLAALESNLAEAQRKRRFRGKCATLQR